MGDYGAYRVIRPPLALARLDCTGEPCALRPSYQPLLVP